MLRRPALKFVYSSLNVNVFGVATIIQGSNRFFATKPLEALSERAIYRRTREKRHLKTKQDIALESDVLVFPRERVGLDYDLNWALVGDYGVAPRGDAHRNASSRRIKSHATVDQKTGAVLAPGTRVTPKPSVARVDTDLSDTEFAALFKQVRRSQFSDAADTLFVHDSELAGGVRTRVVTDCPAFAQFARIMFPAPAAGLGSAVDFKPAVVAFVSCSKLNPTEQPQLVVHPKLRVVLSVGHVDFSRIQEAVAEMVAGAAADQADDGAAAVQIVNADVVKHEGTVALVFNPVDRALSPGYQRSVRARGHAAVFPDGTVRPLWSGSSFLAAGDGGRDESAAVVELVEGGGRRVTGPLASLPPGEQKTLSSPNRVVFVTAGKTTESKPMTVDEAVKANGQLEPFFRQLKDCKFYAVSVNEAQGAKSFEQTMVNLLINVPKTSAEKNAAGGSKKKK